MGSETLRFSFKELEDFTGDFSSDNLIGIFQFGEIYRGDFFGRGVVVKKWICLDNIYEPPEGVIEGNFQSEIRLLQNPKMRNHPTMVKLIGYCDEGEEQFGTVLDLNALDSLYNIVLEDEFSWMQRMKVLMGIGFLFEFMHEKEEGRLPYLLRNFDAHHIILDEDYCPKLVDLSMACFGEFPEKPAHRSMGPVGCRGYIDGSVLHGDGWSDKVDVHSFGILTLMLIGKMKYFEENYLMNETILEWADHEFKEVDKLRVKHRGYVRPRTNNNLVHKSFVNKQVGYYHCDAIALSELAMHCIEDRQIDRPTMKDVVNVLRNLTVVRRFNQFFGLDRV